MSRRGDARRDATRVITAALKVDHLTVNGVLPVAKNTPKNQRLDLLRGYINELADQFIKDEDNDNTETLASGHGLS